ncbi:G0/G1 switch protein 2-like [Thalassophryne amazonica]|uniref:G0/G1 switch protein 2-like n=1 Tax=Thalassophryne amazonica TaxID=390379 RepID=UPI001470D992|nr:G0/G1 switch protein 2-like [Thalassophryne amazonica]
MDSVQELIPFAKELVRQKPSRRLLKVYLLGSVFAVLGMLLGLMEAVCQPFSSTESLDPDMVLLLARMERSAEAERRRKENSREEEERVGAEEIPAGKTSVPEAPPHIQRTTANRLHAS